jgi:hypothetical protein
MEGSMPPTDAVSRLRARLATLSGPAQTGTLGQLAQALQERYWRTGPGSPAGLPDLSAAIDALNEAYGYLDRGNALRGQVAAMRGWLLGIRHVAHGGSERDRETGIHLLEESLTFPNLSPAFGATVRLVLGQLYFARVAQSMQSAGFALASGRDRLAPASKADMDRAVTCFREVLAAETISDEITAAARSMLTVAEAMQTMLSGLGGGIAGLDFSGMMEVLAVLQKMKDQAGGAGTAGLGGSYAALVSRLPHLPLPDPDALAALDPLDRPVALIHGPEPSAPPTQRVRQPAATAPVYRDPLRRALHDKVSAMTKDHSGSTEIWASATAVLLPDAPQPEIEAVDECVALATVVVDGEPAADPVTAGIDRFLLAVSLYLRHSLENAGHDAGSGDRLAGAENLLAAAQAIPPKHPAAVAILLALGAFLDERRPLDSVLDVVAAGFAERADAVIATGTAKGADLASAHALRCVCRAAAALRSGTFAELAELERAVATVPLDYPWRSRLQAAAGEAARDQAGNGGAMPSTDVVSAVQGEASPDSVSTA